MQILVNELHKLADLANLAPSIWCTWRDGRIDILRARLYHEKGKQGLLAWPENCFMMAEGSRKN